MAKQDNMPSWTFS